MSEKPKKQAEKSKAPQGQDINPQLSVLTQYVKDLSFENPSAPRHAAVNEKGEPPQGDISINVGIGQLGKEEFEVTLHFRVNTKIDDKPAFVIELLYGGVFRLQNIPEPAIEKVLMVDAPRYIFPFARRILADVTRDGGFPPLLLDPVDFVRLYEAQKARIKKAEAQKHQEENGDNKTTH